MSEILDFFDSMYSKHDRYWYPNLDDSERYSLTRKHHTNWQVLLDSIRQYSNGTALDLGAGEGTDAIKLALLGYEVDAVEGSATGAEKIHDFAKKQKANVNVIHEDILNYQPTRKYDVVICNGVLHYIKNKISVLETINNCTSARGHTLISLFSNVTPTPECHQVIDVFPDSEKGAVHSFFSEEWNIKHSDFIHDRLDLSHPGFPNHRHSFIKFVLQKIGN